jgi:hypothetical protein
MTLARLIAAEVDGNPAEQHLLVSALLLGGNVTTATGKDVGGTFGHLPACRTPGQTGCVIAYSSFPATPPAFAFFGRSTGAGDQVMCTDPSRLAGGTGALHPYVPTERLSGGRGLGRGVAEPRGSTAGFATYPGYLTARCRTAAGATFLQVTAAAANGRPAFRATLGPQWGLHVYDVNIALGDLVESVRLQAATWSQAATGA